MKGDYPEHSFTNEELEMMLKALRHQSAQAEYNAAERAKLEGRTQPTLAEKQILDSLQEQEQWVLNAIQQLKKGN